MLNYNVSLVHPVSRESFLFHTEFKHTKDRFSLAVGYFYLVSELSIRSEKRSAIKNFRFDEISMVAHKVKLKF